MQEGGLEARKREAISFSSEREKGVFGVLSFEEKYAVALWRVFSPAHFGEPLEPRVSIGTFKGRRSGEFDRST